MRAEPEEFLRRAGEEARRYGGDPWVFLRELIQNARDASAGSVEIVTGSAPGYEWVEVRDDGEGMDGEQAHRFLFTLYASSKADGARAAGRFGVGFWSVLRFGPSRIEVCSTPRRGTGWRVVLDGRLAVLEESVFEGSPGTMVRLVRPADGRDLRAAVLRAARESARFVTRRQRGFAGLRVTVDGREVAEPFSLPPPALSFRRRGVRGVVGLAPAPRVELHAFGLKVREAATLEELLGEGRSSHGPDGGRDRHGLAPRVLLDSDRLEVLLARGDVREDRALRRLVELARRELDRLLRTELDRRAPRGPAARLTEGLARLAGLVRSRRAVLALLGAAAIGIAGAEAIRKLATAPADEAPRTSAAAQARPAYRDLAASYRGPDVGLGDGGLAAPAIRYRPPASELLLAVLLLDGRSLADPEATGPLRPAAELRGRGTVVELELELDAGPGAVRLPVPTGMAVDPGSAVLDGVPVAVVATARGEAALVLDGRVSGILGYRTQAAAGAPAGPLPSWPQLPPDLAEEAARIARLDPLRRPEAAVAAVQARVAYDRSPATVARHRAARASGGEVVARALAVGAGDCDVQNAVLAALLDAAGLPARLAVGYVGQGGAALPGLHAWVEYLGADGRWRPADASAVAASAAAEPRPFAEGQAVGSAPPGPARRWPLAAAVGLAGLTALLAWPRLRTSRELEPGDGLDLAAVVRGVIERPEAFAGLAAAERRPLIPCRGGRRLSVAAARRLVRRRRLLRSSGPSALAERAVAAGAAVVDASLPEGEAAANGLGAVDLDRWDRRLAASRPAGLAALESTLERCGAEIRLVPAGPGEAPSCLDLGRLGLGRGVVLALDPEAVAARPADAGSAAAALALLAWVEAELGEAPLASSEGLARVARAALGSGDRG